MRLRIPLGLICLFLVSVSSSSAQSYSVMPASVTLTNTGSSGVFCAYTSGSAFSCLMQISSNTQLTYSATVQNATWLLLNNNSQSVSTVPTSTLLTLAVNPSVQVAT